MPPSAMAARPPSGNEGDREDPYSVHSRCCSHIPLWAGHHVHAALPLAPRRCHVYDYPGRYPGVEHANWMPPPPFRPNYHGPPAGYTGTSRTTNYTHPLRAFPSWCNFPIEELRAFAIATSKRNHHLPNHVSSCIGPQLLHLPYLEASWKAGVPPHPSSVTRNTHRLDAIVS